jgi:septal ring-binding cell division protein DamX
MKAKSVMYAAVGAPVVAARKVGEQMDALRLRLDKETTDFGKRTDRAIKAAEKAMESWAVEGEKMVDKISDGKVVEEISAKVDLDQAKEQVSRLRDQLEDMLSTWRTSFRPVEDKTARVTEAVKAPVKKPAAKKPAAKKPAARKPAARKPAAKASAAQTTKSSTAAKTSPAKTTAAKTAKAS